MITREAIEKLFAEMPPEMRQEVGLLAEFSDKYDRMEINVFSADGRALTVADVIATLLSYQTNLLTQKVNGHTRIPWSPRDKEGKTLPPAARTGRYWGE